MIAFEDILDRVDVDGTAEFTAADWAVLALAALYQAGVTPRTLMRAVEDSRGHSPNWDDILRSWNDILDSLGDVLDSREVQS